MLPEADRIRLRHMLEAAVQGVSFVEGRKRSDLEADAQLRMALLRAFEVIGEAASRVSAETRTSLPSIPWQFAISMRNRLIHAYFDIDLDIVWITATESLPKLLPVLQGALDSDGPSA